MREKFERVFFFFLSSSGARPGYNCLDLGRRCLSLAVRESAVRALVERSRTPAGSNRRPLGSTGDTGSSPRHGHCQHNGRNWPKLARRALWGGPTARRTRRDHGTLPAQPARWGKRARRALWEPRARTPKQLAFHVFVLSLFSVLCPSKQNKTN